MYFHLNEIIIIISIQDILHGLKNITTNSLINK